MQKLFPTNRLHQTSFLHLFSAYERLTKRIQVKTVQSSKKQEGGGTMFCRKKQSPNTWSPRELTLYQVVRSDGWWWAYQEDKEQVIRLFIEERTRRTESHKKSRHGHGAVTISQAGSSTNGSRNLKATEELDSLTSVIVEISWVHSLLRGRKKRCR